MRLKRPVSAVMLVLSIAGEAAQAETTCTPNTLGNQFCPVAPPPPRPIYRRPVQALDRVMREPQVGSQAPAFVPSRETGRLGNQTITDQNLRTGICRKDTLGNLLCR